MMDKQIIRMRARRSSAPRGGSDACIPSRDAGDEGKIESGKWVLGTVSHRWCQWDTKVPGWWSLTTKQAALLCARWETTQDQVAICRDLV